jgi:hypothetical protein
MSTNSVVISLNVLKNTLFCKISPNRSCAVNQLCFNRMEKTFTSAVIPAITFTSHAALYNQLTKGTQCTILFKMKVEFVYNFDPIKNKKLIEGRGISFEEIIAILANRGPLDVMMHSDPMKYPYQKIYIVEFHDYAYLVPFVEDGNQIFLKTAFPSRKAAKKYLNRGDL